MSGYTPPATGRPTPFVLTTLSEWALGKLHSTFRAQVGASAWPGANAAIFIPFRLTESRTFTGVLWENGGTNGNNVNVAVYSADGTTALATIGSTVQGTVSVFQKVAFGTPLTLPPGTYYLAFACDGTTSIFLRLSTTAGFLRTAGVRRLASFFALTASAVAWTGATDSYVPIVGLYEASWL